MYASKPDRVLIILLSILVLSGFLVFVSASLGLLARPGAEFSLIAIKQGLVTFVFGGTLCYFASRIQYKTLKKYSLPIAIATLLLTLAVFLPYIGWSHGGARRWISLGFTTIQPSEFLKLGLVIYAAAWYSFIKQKISKWQYGFLSFCAFLGIAGILLLQPDTGTFLVLAFALSAIYLAAGAPLRDFAIMVLCGVLVASLLIFTRPYIRDRIDTFLDPGRDPHGAGYQIQQSLIAIGSGGMTGRGFGQSIQKFDYIPEPIGDSIFAVMSEEFGLVGSMSLLGLYVLFALRAYRIARSLDDVFGRLLVIGITVIILSQACINIASMLGLMPLTGVPLPFVSHGGSAMLMMLVSVGILLNISRYAKIGRIHTI